MTCALTGQCDITHWGSPLGQCPSHGSPASSNTPHSNDVPAPTGGAPWSHDGLSCRLADCEQCCGAPLMPALEPPCCHESYLVNRRHTTGENTAWPGQMGKHKHVLWDTCDRKGQKHWLPSNRESLSLPCNSWMSNGRQPDWRMAMHESCELDMASSVRDMSSLSWVPNMDRRLYTISTCRGQHRGLPFYGVNHLHTEMYIFTA